MKLTIKTENGQKVVDLKNDLQFNTLKGEQYVFSNGFSNYILNFKDNQESVILTFNVDGKSIKVELNGIVPLLQANTASMTNPTAIIINKDTNDKDVNNIVENNNFNGGEIIDRLEALLSKPVELGNNVGSNLTLITDYQTLLESLGAAAAGGEATGGTSNGSTFNSIFSLDSGSLADIADTARWENLTESISNIPVETADTVAAIVEDPINVNVKLIGINTEVIEGENATYKVTLTDDNGNAVIATENITVTFTYTYITASGEDISETISVVIPAGSSEAPVIVKTIDDNFAEEIESFTLELDSISNQTQFDTVSIDKTPVTTTITDETTPTDPDTQTAYVSIEGPTSVVEGNTTTPYTVSVTQAPTEDLTVTFTYTGKAIDGTDFTGVASVVIPKGEKSVTFDISTIDDNLAEGSENFTVTINSITNGGLEDVRVDSVKSSVTTTITDETPIITLIGSTVTEITDGTATGDKVKGIVTATIDKVQSEDLTIILNDNSIITIKAGKLTGSVEVETSRIDDVYKQGTTEEIISIASTSNSKINIENIEAIITIKDDIDPIDLTITATVTTPKIIDVTTATDGTTGVKITGFNSDGEQVDLSIITKTDHDGFGIDGKNLSNGDSRELGVGEKIVVEFTDGKDVNSLDVSFAWRNNHETAKLTFIKDGQIVGYAKVTGDGSSTTKAIVTYYDENNNLIKTVNAKGSSDKVDEAFTFELPDANGGIVSFDKVEFSAPTNVDDYLINKIVYKEVLDPSVTNIITNGGDVTFNIQIDEDYPPQGSAKAIVSVNGIDYEVVLNATGRGTLTIDSAELGDLSKVNVIVKEIIGGNYEKVNLVEKDFDFTPIITIPTSSNDAISTDEDVAYILKVTDFGEVSGNTQEFKITQLPTNGKLFLTITIGDTIFNPDGTQTIATQNTKVEITKDQIISLAQIGAEKVEFVPNKNSDNDGSFNFQVGDGKGNFSNDYTTTINVVAVADAPTASIDITKIGATTISTGNNDNGNSGTNSSFDKLVKQTATGKDGNLEQDMQQTNSNQDIEKDYQNVNANNITTGLGNDTLKFQALNNKTVTTGEGNDKVIIDNGSNNNIINVGNGNNEISITYSLNQGSITAGSGNDTLFVGNAADGSIVSMGAGNDKVQIDGDFKSKVYLGAGDDKIALYSPHTNFEADGRSYIDGGSGFDTLYVENLNSNDFKVKIKSTGEEISWDKYSELNNHQNGEANIEFVIYHKINTNQGFVVKNIEQIVFSDKTISGETTTSAVEYKVDISASLTDTDGSETLSVVIKNIPTGAILESTKYDVSKNPDGSWSVNFKTGTTGNDLLEIKDSLTLKVPRSYKEKINLEIESKATESRDNSNGENFATAKDDASVVTVTIEPFNAELDMDISEATIKVIETKDVNILATSSAGIYEKDGKYYKTEVQSHTEKVLDTEALKNLQVTINGKTYTGITVGADGKYYVIDNTIAKEQKTIEVEREVTKTVELNSIDSFMIEVTKETKGIVLGKEVTDLGKNDTIAKNNFKTYTLEQPTSNIEIKLVSGSAKIEFVDANGKVIGSSITQTGTDSKGYSVPKDAVGVKITSTSNLKIDAIKYHVDPHEETVQVGGKILDIEGMEKAGISWNNTISEEKIQTQDITKLGSTVGDGNIKGFNPEAKANSQVFDFGKDKAYQLVTIKVDATISGSWNFNKDSTKDVFVVSANGVPQGAYNYTSSQDYNSKTPSQTTLNTDIATAKTNGYDLSYVNGTLNKIYEYKVYLDENGQVQMNFVVASTNTDEFVTVNNIFVSYEGLSGFVQTKTEIEKVTETIFVGVPTNIEYKGEVPTKDIIKYENVEVETTPIYTKITQYEYVLDLSASITDTDTDGNGELSNIITLEDIPNGVTIKGYEANEDGTYTVEIGEDGKAQLTLISDSLLNDTDKESIKANITATDGTQSSEIKVNIDEKEESSQFTTFDGEGDIDLTSIIGQYKVNYIDLENGKANDIKLDFDEILADDKEIYIKGDDKDSISLNSDLWKEAEATNVDGVKYNVYTGTNSAANSTIKLLIDDDIQINHDI